MRINRIIVTIGKHVIAQQPLTGGGEGVGVEEAAGFGVVVAVLQIIQAGLNVEDVAAVAQRVNVGMLTVAVYPFSV